jgi:hypothetical protein
VRSEIFGIKFDDFQTLICVLARNIPRWISKLSDLDYSSPALTVCALAAFHNYSEILWARGRTPWTAGGGGSACRKATTYTGQHEEKKRGQTLKPGVGFETTIPVFERTKTFRALDRAAAVIGIVIV